MILVKANAGRERYSLSAKGLNDVWVDDLLHVLREMQMY